uniref:Uncharacterized protein n=1 Tax=Timema bartmani TaxID=61472 RepID=A0A7R9I1K7_9NEOP|nr:unnamed protein product [Timema bartmani]
MIGARDHANACTGVQILVKKQAAVLCFGGGGVIFRHENAVHFKCSLSEVIDDEYITQDSLSLDKSKKEETVCYEDFCENSMSNTKEIPQETNDEFLLFYDNLNIAELRSLAAKFGPLLRKERFIFLDQYRRCWAGLIGHLLLVYSGERDTKPSFNIDLHGYEARPAPNYIQRDLKRRDIEGSIRLRTSRNQRGAGGNICSQTPPNATGTDSHRAIFFCEGWLTLQLMSIVLESLDLQMLSDSRDRNTSTGASGGMRCSSPGASGEVPTLLSPNTSVLVLIELPGAVAMADDLFKLFAPSLVMWCTLGGDVRTLKAEASRSRGAIKLSYVVVLLSDS